MKKLLLILVLLTGFAISSTAQTRMGVYVGGNVSPYLKEVISASASSSIALTCGVIAVERIKEFCNALEKEVDFQLSGLVADKDVVALGRRYSADCVAVIVARCDCDRAEGFVSGKIIDVKTGAELDAYNVRREIESNDDWIAMANHVIFRLFANK